MNRIVLIGLLLIMSCKGNKEQNKDLFRSYSINDSTIYLETNSYRGVIFKPNYSLYPGKSKVPVTNLVHESYSKGWVPDKKDIISFENTFTEYWQKAKTDTLAKIHSRTPILWKRIDILERQYIGFIDTIGQKKLWVNIFNVDTTDTVWKSIPYSSSASGLAFYEIKYNVKEDSIYDIYRY